MNLLCILVIVWAVAAIIRKIASASHEREAERERERIREEQQIIRLEQIRAREAERQRSAWQKEQERINRERARKQAEHARAIAKAAQERERLKREQERQAAVLAKHEEMIARNTQILKQAVADIDFQNERLAELDAQLDYIMLQQAGTVPGSKEHTRYQNKIVSLHNQIHTAESKLSRAQFNREQARRKLA